MPHYLMPDGEKLYVREFGQGTPVLVLSGLGMQSWQWLPFLYQHRKSTAFTFLTGGVLVVQHSAKFLHWMRFPATGKI